MHFGSKEQSIWHEVISLAAHTFLSVLLVMHVTTKAGHYKGNLTFDVPNHNMIIRHNGERRLQINRWPGVLQNAPDGIGVLYFTFIQMQVLGSHAVCLARPRTLQCDYPKTTYNQLAPFLLCFLMQPTRPGIELAPGA